MSPRPRTCLTIVVLGRQLRRAARGSRSPALTALASTPPSSASSTASAAAQQTGLAPNVEPCEPGTKPSAASSRASTAPIGMPPPRPLAEVRMSGVTSCSYAKSVPVRPMPVCTSSRISNAPARSQIVAQRAQVAVGRNDHAAFADDRLDEHGGGLRRRRRPRPRRRRRRAQRARSRSSIGPKPSCRSGWPVAASAPSVRP